MSSTSDGNGGGVTTAADLAAHLGSLTLGDAYTSPPPSSQRSHSHSHSQSASHPHSPVVANPYSSPPHRNPSSDSYDYQNQVYYAGLTPGSGLPLDPPFSPAPPTQAGYGYGSLGQAQLNDLESPTISQNPYEYAVAEGYGAAGPPVQVGVGAGGDLGGEPLRTPQHNGGFQRGGGAFRTPQSQGDAHYQGNAPYYGYQDGRQFWSTQQGVFTQRDNRRANQNVHPLHTPAPHTSLRHQPLHSAPPHVTAFSPLQFASSQTHTSFGLATPPTPQYHHGPGGVQQVTPYVHGSGQQAGSFGMQHHAPYGLATPFSPMGSFSHVPRPRRYDDSHLQRSALLEDFKINKMNKRWDLNDIFGHIVEFSGDQHGSRLVQQKLELASIEDKQKIFDEIMPNAYALMTDVFGNYVCQKLFEYGNQRQKAALAKEMEGKVVTLSMQMYGCRVVQKAFDHVLVDQREALMAELDGRIVECVKSSNANHVVQRMVTLNPAQSVPDSFVGHVEELSVHPYGCRVLQKIFECLPDVMKRGLLEEMHRCTMKLIEDQFGNYVIQSVITHGEGKDRDRVIARMKGQIVPLSKHKFASNVVEKALCNSNELDRRDIIAELIGMQPDGSNRVGIMLRDPFANFPIQTALFHGEHAQRQQLFEIISGLMNGIRHTPVGKRLEMKLADMEEKENFALPSASASGPASADASPAPPLSSSISTNRTATATDMSRSGSSSTRVTSPDRDRDRERVNMRNNSTSAPPTTSDEALKALEAFGVRVMHEVKPVAAATVSPASAPTSGAAAGAGGRQRVEEGQPKDLIGLL